jgi:hypothetical protein
MDDVEARAVANKIFENPECFVDDGYPGDTKPHEDGVTIPKVVTINKLQKVYKDKAPESLEW